MPAMEDGAALIGADEVLNGRTWLVASERS
jgi:hypothetical protein